MASPNTPKSTLPAKESLIVARVENRSPLKKNSLEVYPNPSKGIFKVSWSIENQSDNLTMLLLDAEGRTLKSIKLKNSVGQINWDLSYLSDGIYVVKIQDHKSLINYKKLIINK